MYVLHICISNIVLYNIYFNIYIMCIYMCMCVCVCVYIYIWYISFLTLTRFSVILVQVP